MKRKLVVKWKGEQRYLYFEQERERYYIGNANNPDNWALGRELMYQEAHWKGNDMTGYDIDESITKTLRRSSLSPEAKGKVWKGMKEYFFPSETGKHVPNDQIARFREKIAKREDEKEKEMEELEKMHGWNIARTDLEYSIDRLNGLPTGDDPVDASWNKPKKGRPRKSGSDKEPTFTKE